jgi:hypothetical protein
LLVLVRAAWELVQPEQWQRHCGDHGEAVKSYSRNQRKSLAA